MGIVNGGFFSSNKDTPVARCPICCCCRNRDTMWDLPHWETIKIPPRFLAHPLVLKRLLRRTYGGEVRAEDVVPRSVPRCPVLPNGRAAGAGSRGAPLGRLPEPASSALPPAVLRIFIFLLVFVFIEANGGWIMHDHRTSLHWFQEPSCSWIAILAFCCSFLRSTATCAKLELVFATTSFTSRN